jgi:hypothetical protein
MAYRPLSFNRGSKGIAGNGGASHVWKGEIVQMAYAFGHLLSKCSFFYHNSRNYSIDVPIKKVKKNNSIWKCGLTGFTALELELNYILRRFGRETRSLINPWI